MSASSFHFEKTNFFTKFGWNFSAKQCLSLCLDVNLVTEPKPYQKKKLTFTEHGSRASKSIESQPDSQLESSKRSNEPTVREPDSSRESFKRKSSGDSSHSLRLSYLPISVGNSRFPLSHLSNEPHSSRDASHSPPNSIHSSAEASQNLITSSTERTSSSASSRPSYLHNSTNQARKVTRQPAQQLQQPTAKQLQPMAKLSYPNSPYLNSFEALMSSIYQQHARSNQPSHYPSNQPNVYLQTSGQQPPGDLVVCGTCKRVFYSFSIFLQHKQAMCLPTADLCIANAR